MPHRALSTFTKTPGCKLKSLADFSPYASLVFIVSLAVVYVQVMLRCAPQLREDQREWAIVVHSIIDSSVAANRLLLQLLSRNRQEDESTFGEDVVEDYLVWCGQV